MKLRILIGCLVIAVMVIGLSGLAAAEEINLVGTENGETVFKAVAAAFEKARPGVAVRIPESIDSGGGIKAVADGKARIARVARDFNDNEKSYGLTFLPFARVKIVFFTHESVGIDGLTSRQAADIFSGKIGDWSEVGGTKDKIRVVVREEGDSAAETLEETLDAFDDLEYTVKAKTVYSDTEAADIAAKKAGVIAFGTYGLVKIASVRILALDGKRPEEKEYPCGHPVGLVFRESDKTGVVGAFIDFVMSPEGREAAIASGGDPL